MENKGTILYAEDSEDTREFVKEFIDWKLPEYNLELFVDGTGLKKRLKELVSNPKDVRLVITDNSMPGINGGKIIEQYAKKFEFPFALAYGGVGDIGEKAIEDGAFDYLEKPFLGTEFVDFVQRALDSYEK